MRGDAHVKRGTIYARTRARRAYVRDSFVSDLPLSSLSLSSFRTFSSNVAARLETFRRWSEIVEKIARCRERKRSRIMHNRAYSPSISVLWDTARSCTECTTARACYLTHGRRRGNTLFPFFFIGPYGRESVRCGHSCGGRGLEWENVTLVIAAIQLCGPPFYSEFVFERKNARECKFLEAKWILTRA